jgi:hypothetical protein
MKKCEIYFGKLENYQFLGGERIITSVNYCNPNGCTTSKKFVISNPEIKIVAAPSVPPVNISISNKTNASSIAFSWSNLSYNIRGSGGVNSDYKIWYYNDSISEKVLLTNSTKG